MPCPRCSHPLADGTTVCPNCGLRLGPASAYAPTAAYDTAAFDTQAGATATPGWGAASPTSARSWATEPPAFPPRLPPASPDPGASLPYGVTPPGGSPAGRPDDQRGTTLKMVLAAVGAAIIVALVVVTVVVYATRPNGDLAAGTSSTTSSAVVTTSAPTTSPPTTAAPTTVTTVPATTAAPTTAPATTTPAPDWVTYADKAFGFSVDFPTTPDTNRAPVPDDLGGGRTTLASAEADDGSKYGVLPITVKGNLSADQFAKVAGIIATNDGVRPDAISTTALAGQPAITYTTTSQGVRSRVVVVGHGKTVLLLVANASGEPDRFFRSLTFS